MKILRLMALASFVFAGIHSARADLYVVQVGDGSAALTSSATGAFIKKFTNDGTANGSISLPTAASGANQPLSLSGTATSEGFLALSADGQYLTLAGYAVAPGAVAGNIANSTSAAAPRGVARITLGSESIDTSTAFTGDSTYTEGNPRSAVTSNGTDLWATGPAAGAANAGVRYATLGSNTSLQLSTAPTNVRVANIFNGQLYVSSASGAFLGVSTVGSGLPTTDSQTITLLPGFPTTGTHSSYDFWFKDASTLYVADDSSAANGGGIQKWTESGGTWSLEYTLLNTGATTTGARGLAGTIDDSNNAVLYATTTQTSNNNLIRVVDAGAGSTATILASAGTNAVFRGVEFVASTTTPVNNADFDNSGTVDGRDFLIWQRGYGLTSETGKANGNANADTFVDDADYAAWKLKFGGPPAVAAATGVPEPGALGLAVMAGLAWQGARRQRSK